MILVVILGSISDLEHAFHLFQKHAERLLNAKIRALQSDWDDEYRHLSRHIMHQGIHHHVMRSHASQQNGIA
jgi:hypothetical protein